jgi:hypothetical protein
MNWIVAHFKGILIVSGLLTFTMIQAAFAPGAALGATFGHNSEGPLALLIVRNWGILIALMGILLIHAAYRPQNRGIAITIAGLSKLAFIMLVLAHGSEYLAYQAGLAVVVDAVMVTLFTAYLLNGAMNSRTVSAPSSSLRTPSTASATMSNPPGLPQSSS